MCLQLLPWFWVYICDIVTSALSWRPSCSMHLLFLWLSGFPFSGFQHTNLCSGRVCPRLASVFHSVTEKAACSHTDLWTETWSSRGNTHLPSHQHVCFPPYTTRREWNLTILRHLRGENTPPRSYAIYKHKKKNVPYFFHGLFKNGKHSSRATCGVREGFVGRTQQTHSLGREWKCSVMVERWRLVVIRDHLFLSEHKAPAFSLRDRWISGSELDRKIKGDTLINEILWHWDVWWFWECFPTMGQIKS